jgi:arsenate reductase-like glutaredoxin family protein
MNNDQDIDSIIQELKADEIPASSKPETPHEYEHVSDENVGEYVYKKSAELVESTLSAVQSLKNNVLTGSDSKEIAALSQLINSATKALDQLNKINLQNKQSKNEMEIKKMEIEANAERPILPNTTNVLIATRDEVMKQIFDKPTKRPTIDLIEGEFTKD